MKMRKFDKHESDKGEQTMWKKFTAVVGHFFGSGNNDLHSGGLEKVFNLLLATR